MRYRAMDVKIFTDGSCYPPHTPGGWAAILVSGERRKEISGHIPGQTTNIRAEAIAVIEGLRALKGGPHDVTIVTDSQYVCGAIEGMNNPRANIDLIREIERLCKLHRVKVEWVRGHSGHPENERCDELAGQARLLQAVR